jgi:FtsZ-binding cell division protein ZapB
MSPSTSLSTSTQDLDSLASLEQKITLTVELVNTLRAEKSALEARLDSAVAERDAVRQELDDLRSERKQVRTRIEKLLGQMDLLSTT